ncbi:PAS/PAC sensor signal transduction histidine kinase [Longilinea arvoryzae]|uniref:histidine kinase n=1 Tax=Longilinea arvoryzae TaxID=360412 RepID=A0A0S7BBP9_9CHLR|nr:ATP-binding protein [Longilinea arvoryzae]GAP15244.1 PAS/PAC sensor signal transduction histidine kinase [Longilinea arvoryzae]
MRDSIVYRIAVPYLILVTVILIALGAFLNNYMDKTYVDQLTVNQFASTRLFANQIAPVLDQGEPYPTLSDLTTQTSFLLNTRITVILPDGKVIADSERDPSTLENHLDRPEVKGAIGGQETSEVRYSDTLRTRLLYTATPIRLDGKVIGVARMAISLASIEAHTRQFRGIIFATAGVTALLVVLLAFGITYQTVQPLRSLTTAVARLESGKYVESIPGRRLDEIGRLSNAFNRMAAQISTQIKELSAERSKLSAVLATMSDGILIVNADGLVELINPAAERIFSISASESLGKTLAEVIRHHVIVDLWKKTQSTGEQQITSLETPDRLILQAIATPLETDDGRTLILLQDYTRMRRLETVRRDFISNVSHELRTPLASLKALTETVQETALDDPPAARRFLERMSVEIDNLTQLVQELLDLSRIESGRVQLERTLIAPKELIQPAVDRMRIQAERSGLTLTMDCPEDLPRVNVDASRMEQVLVNLIHNAIKFTPPGGSIQIRGWLQENDIILAISDTGVGIAEEDLKRIFERFYKADRARSGGGTGLGLSIARHLVESHGGRIWAESEIGKGSTFFISIPPAQ